MKDLFKNKWISAGAVLAVVAGLGYYVWTSSGSGDLLQAGPSGASQQILATLNQLHTIKLDPALFNDPTFKSLTDYGVTIPPQTPGRRNPFAPVGQ